ncbi:MAG: hypothetical protein K2J38_02160, partial [Muribaculaceae bacterium]|nr:hypothetical protein [Muribaculaceae bacterium]
MIEYSTHYIGESRTPVRMACFTSEGGSEASLFIYPAAALIKDAVTETTEALEEMLHRLRMKGLRPVFMRWFMSDIMNQADAIRPTDYQCPVSVTGQPPLDSGKIVLWVHMKNGIRECRPIDDKSFRIAFDDNTVEYRCVSYNAPSSEDSEQQTHDILGRYCAMLRHEGLTLEHDCVRTWFFIRDIDTNYAGMVRARNSVFDIEGLTSDTHYITSTGIGGDMKSPDTLVSFDALAIAGKPSPEIRYLYGPTHLNRTSDYGVAFERGSIVDTPGKRRVYIS